VELVASNQRRIWIGTAGWTIPRESAPRFARVGTHLQRYAGELSCTEINSSFYRPHAFGTYAKWSAATPPPFQFAVKMPRVITHEQKLRRPRLPLERFLAETNGLGAKRGPILVQLPPSHAFDARVVARFFDHFRARYEGSVVCEPRHPSWFTAAADRLLQQYKVARVAADPALAKGAGVPGGWCGLSYFRLHGSPRTYWSRYCADYIETLARALQAAAASADAWCVFDNTAAGAAVENALELRSQVAPTNTTSERL
jgi:uncharacterized protein YecE (DUF72 family)